MKCAQPGCSGTIVDGYCDVCGLAPAGTPGSGNARRSSASPLDAPSAVTSQSGSDAARPGAARVGALDRRQPTDAAAHRDNADVAARRRADPGSVGTDHRSAAGVDGPADRRRGQALLLGVRSARSAGLARARPVARRGSARSAARRSTSIRSCSRARWSAASTRWSAAWRTVAWVGSTSPAIATSTIAGSC